MWDVVSSQNPFSWLQNSTLDDAILWNGPFVAALLAVFGCLGAELEEAVFRLHPLLPELL